jgi:hypothetical protein
MARRSTKKPEAFSATLQKWLKKRKGDKTLLGMNEAFGEKTFAIAFLIFMALPALPIPTAGVTHVTELATMILALQMIAGRSGIWLPNWISTRIHFGKLLGGKAGKRLISTVGWFERRSSRRGAVLLANPVTQSIIGLVVLLLTMAAFAAPPFSGLDTLPALGVVVISLALILEDFYMLAVGIIVGVAGVSLEVIAGAELYKGLTHFL